MHRIDIVLRPEIRESVKELFGQPLADAEKLLHEVSHHARVVEIVAKKKRPSQLPLIHALAQGLMELVKGLNEASPAQHRRLVQAACRYFADNQEAGDHDLASDTGLDDDAEVFVAVATWVGRQDLADEISDLEKRSKA